MAQVYHHHHTPSSTTTTAADSHLLSQDCRELPQPDVQILTSGGLRIPSHSSILASASPVLENIIDRPRKHRSSERLIPIVGVPCEAVAAFIRFLYSSRCADGDLEKYGIHLLALSHVYLVPHLKQICAKSLGHRLTIENVVDVLQLARLCDSPDLYVKSMKLVYNNFKAVENTEGWKFMQDHDPWLELQILQFIDEVEGQNFRNGTGLWSSIVRSSLGSDELSQVFSKGIGLTLGDGRRIPFWSCEWIQGMVLQQTFPRIFALAENKYGMVCEYGSFIDSKWVWRISLRRQLFDWEISQWNRLCLLIKDFQVCQALEDSVIWKGSSSGRFSVKQFCLDCRGAANIAVVPWESIWTAGTPPKVSSFVWRVLRGRVAVREELGKRGLLQTNAQLCALCNKEVESVSHLFFHCTTSWKIWSRWFSIWGLVWCAPADPITFFLAWNEGIPSHCCSKIWRILMFATIWSIWLCRNDVVFNNGRAEIAKLADSILLRVAHWVMAKWTGLEVRVDDFLNSPNCIRVPSKPFSPRVAISWTPPPVGWVKFNVDGSAMGKPGPAGIGGVLRDRLSHVKIVFSKPIGVVDSNWAEFRAANDALQLFVDSQWVHTHRLILESDSTNVVKWVRTPSTVPWRLRGMASHIGNLIRRVLAVSVVHVMREANTIADRLAKTGVQRLNDLVVVYRE